RVAAVPRRGRPTRRVPGPRGRSRAHEDGAPADGGGHAGPRGPSRGLFAHRRPGPLHDRRAPRLAGRPPPGGRPPPRLVGGPQLRRRRPQGRTRSGQAGSRPAAGGSPFATRPVRVGSGLRSGSGRRNGVTAGGTESRVVSRKILGLSSLRIVRI